MGICKVLKRFRNLADYTGFLSRSTGNNAAGDFGIAEHGLDLTDPLPAPLIDRAVAIGAKARRNLGVNNP